jgi:hypothetical protein
VVRRYRRVATFQTRHSGIETVSFNDDLNDRGESYRLLTVLDPNGDHLRQMLRTGDGTDPRFLDMAERPLEEVPQAQRQPLIIREPHDGSASIRGHSDDAGFTPIGSTGELAMIIDTSGRSAPAALVEAAKRYIEA